MVPQSLAGLEGEADEPVSTYHVDHLHKVLWVLSRKNAGTSVRHAIEPFGVGETREEAQRYSYYHTITVIRHPWDRLTSGLHNPYSDSRPFAQKVEDEILRPLRDSWKKYAVAMGINWLPASMDHHLWPQWVTIDTFRIDRWLHFDSLQDDWSALQREFEYPDLEHHNQGEDRDWRRPDGEPFDWSPLLALYEPDFALCADWERV